MNTNGFSTLALLARWVCVVSPVVGLLGLAGCATTPQAKPEPIIGRTYRIPAEETAAARPWGTVRVERLVFQVQEPESGSLRAMDLDASLRTFVSLLAESKPLKVSNAISPVGGPFRLSISCFDQPILDGKALGSFALSRLTLGLAKAKYEHQTTVNLVVERADGKRKFYRAQSKVSGKYTPDGGYLYVMDALVLAKQHVIGDRVFETRSVDGGKQSIVVSGGSLGLLDVVHLATENCLRGILAQMEEDAAFHQ